MSRPDPRAVILDMDGVIVDSEHQWLLAEGPFLRKIVGRWDVSDHGKAVGLGVVDVYRLLIREYGLKMGESEFLAGFDSLAREIYGRRVSLAPGLRRFLSAARERGLPLAVASSSPRAWVDIVLRRFGLAPAFAATVTGDDAPGRTKPAPDIYLLAARRLDVRPRDCLAVEDSAIGVRAAKAAGMRCVGLRSGLNDEQDLSAADSQARGFAELIRRDIGRANVKTQARGLRRPAPGRRNPRQKAGLEPPVGKARA